MNQWAIGIATSLIATLIVATVARLIPSEVTGKGPKPQQV
jgi:hypothetical protein